MQHLLKIILFSVSVPVLSVNIYSTCPKSSLIAVLPTIRKTITKPELHVYSGNRNYDYNHNFLLSCMGPSSCFWINHLLIPIDKFSIQAFY